MPSPTFRRRPLLAATSFLALLALLAGAHRATAGDDAERLAHGDDAATPQRSFEETIGETTLRQYQLGCLSQLTYLIASRGEAAVIDPQRDVAHYRRDAEALGAKITKVFLTHTNADFVAGHTELAAQSGAKVFISGESGSKFPHEPLADRQQVTVGAAVVEAWATPGHTLDSMTLLVRVPGAAMNPAWILTGDTLFIGGIGRPDLVGGEITPIVLAQKAHGSLARLKMLPDDTKVLPAHGAGSLCGAHLSPETVSTVGREKATNPYLAPMSRAQFVSRVVTGLPVAPAYFRYNVALNRAGPPVVTWRDELPPPVAPTAVKDRIAAGAWVVDLRDAAAYAAGHVEGSVNVAVRGRLDTWTGIVVPFEAPLILVGSDDEVREAAFRFRRIGLDHVEGRLALDLPAWTAAGLPVRTTRMWTPKELAAVMARGEEPILADVRTPGEYEELRLGDYANLPLSEADRFGQVLDKESPVLFLCNSAYRSSMAVGLAERQGFRDIANLEGGLDAWLSAGLPTKGTARVVTPAREGAAPTVAAGRPLLLPEPMEPAALATALADQPAAYAVLDIRPAWAFAEYHVPGAVRTDPERVADHVRGLAPGVRVVLLDRDGTTAFAVAAAALAALNDPTRSFRVGVGGTARFFREIELHAGAPGLPAGAGAAPAAAGVPPAGARAAPATPLTPASPAPAPAAPAPAPKKRSAGC